MSAFVGVYFKYSFCKINLPSYSYVGYISHVDFSVLFYQNLPTSIRSYGIIYQRLNLRNLKLQHPTRISISTFYARNPPLETE